MSNPEFVNKTLEGMHNCSGVKLMFEEDEDTLRVFLKSCDLNGNDYVNMVRVLTNAFHWFSNKTLEFTSDAEKFFGCT